MSELRKFGPVRGRHGWEWTEPFERGRNDWLVWVRPVGGRSAAVFSSFSPTEARMKAITYIDLTVPGRAEL